MKKKDKMKMKISLSAKITCILFFTCSLIYLVSVIIGCRIYDRSIYEYYDETVYNAAEIVAGYFKEGELERYAKAAYDYNHGKVDHSFLEKIVEEDRYKEVLSMIYSMNGAIQANDIYVTVIDIDVLNNFTEKAYAEKTWKPMYYIMDSYSDDEKNFKLGDSGYITKKYINEVIDSYNNRKRYEGCYVSKGIFGYNMTALLPVIENDKVTAFIGVEMPMYTLEMYKRNFVIRISVITAIVAIISLLFTNLLVEKSIISPVKILSYEALEFVNNNTKISEKLNDIKTGDEIQTLSESLYSLEVNINEYINNLQRVTAEKERIGAELNVATQIQADMLPRIFPPFPEKKEFDLYATMDPAKEVGGDFYDFFLIDNDHIGLVMADVSGKGVPAALFMVVAKTLIKNRALMGGGPGEVLAYVNDQLCEGNDAELFVTVWFAILEISSGKGIAANAGHEHPILKRKDGKYELVLYKHSMAVATIEGLKFKEHTFELYPGDSLFVYTDGVPEACNEKNEFFGSDRLLDALNKDPDVSPKELLSNVKEALDDFVAGADQFDDITMMGINYFGTQV
ncbi:MAG: PP2C family protein-serine/threonine phosphatase [Lachnospiraceae bacterium]|nr:PP2C family protein-serine/threonine phosphatase [Lachnospiraceae bacterium]